MIPKLKSRVETIILEERNRHAIALTTGIVHKDPDEGIMQLQEAIWRGNLKLREIEEDRV